MNSKISLMALSVSLLASVESFAEMGPVRVNSGLGEPFSATITVSGQEAKELLKGSKPSFSDGRLKANVRKSGGNAIISLRSNGSINEPVIIFQMGIGSKSRQYTALIDPSNPQAKTIADDMKKSVAAEKGNKAENAKDKKNPAPVPKKAKEEHTAPDNGEPGLYVVEKGETLTIIAKKLKPDNWTEAQAVNALIRANKGKLGHRRKNVLYAGLVLNLPPELAQQLSDPSLPAGDKQARQQDAPPPANNGGGETQPPNTAAQPGNPPPAATPGQTEDGGDSDWMKWLMIGGLGGVVVLLAFILYRQTKNGRRNPPPADKKAKGKGAAKEKGKEKGIRTHKPVAKPKNPKGPITKEEAAAALAAQSEGDEWIDDLGSGDDIVFFTGEPAPASEKNKQHGGNAAESFDLNLDALDIDQQQGIMSSAVTDDEETIKLQNADWDKIESTESIYEPDEFDFKKPAAKPAPKTPRPAAKQQTDDFDGFFDIPATPKTVPDAVQASPAPIDDLAFDIPPMPTDTPPAQKPTKGEGTPVTSWASPAYSHSSAEQEAASWASAEIFAKQQPAKPASTMNSPAGKIIADKHLEEPLDISFDIPPLDDEPVQTAPDTALDFALDIPAIDDERPETPVPALDIPPAPAAEPDRAAEQEISLDFSLDEPVESKPAAPAPAAEPVKAAEQEISLDFSLDEPAEDKPAAPAPAAEPVKAAEQEISLDFSLDEPAEDKPAAPAPVAEPVKAAEVSEISFEEPRISPIPPVAEPAPLQIKPKSPDTAVSTEPIGFAAADELNAIEETVEVVAHQTPVPTETAEEKALDLAVVEDLPVPESLTTETDMPPSSPVPAATVETTLPPARPVPAATAAAISDDWLEEDNGSNVVFDDSVGDAGDLNIEWGELGTPDTKNTQPAFVSESVGMTAPLEAKYELAEMYIEIGDPEAAHETLMELLEESQGEILTKSRALLARLNV